MQDIFKRIGIDEAREESGHDVQRIKRAPLQWNQPENQHDDERANQKRRDGVAALHSAGAGNFGRSKINRVGHCSIPPLFYLDLKQAMARSLLGEQPNAQPFLRVGAELGAAGGEIEGIQRALAFRIDQGDVDIAAKVRQR